ncbi:MAG: ABC transporter ATP-binding protein [Thermoguttaceae bacterium]
MTASSPPSSSFREHLLARGLDTATALPRQTHPTPLRQRANALAELDALFPNETTSRANGESPLTMVSRFAPSRNFDESPTESPFESAFDSRSRSDSVSLSVEPVAFVAPVAMPQVPSSPPQVQRPTLLATTQLTKSYPMGANRVEVLRGIEMSVGAGEFLSIVGQSGSGKSTLLHLLGTLDVPDSGQIHFEGERIDRLSSVERDLLRNRFIGFIFQFYHLLPELTALENVLSPLMIRDGVFGYCWRRREYIKRAQELLDRVGLSHRGHHKPNALSGGEMQRVAIARALIAQPKVLLADEPTGNLDTHASAEILSLLRELNQTGLTIVMVTHDMSLAERADRLIRIVDGAVSTA